MAYIALGCAVLGALTAAVLRSDALIGRIVVNENRAPWFLRGRRAHVSERDVRRRLRLQVILWWGFAAAVLVALVISLITSRTPGL